MRPIRPTRRIVELEIQDLRSGEQTPFGAFRPAEAGPRSGPLPKSYESFQRDEESPVELELRQGEVVVLGPRVDPLRCRALPGERELRALRPMVDGILRLEPGVWFCDGQANQQDSPEDLDQRSYREIFNMEFRPRASS